MKTIGYSLVLIFILICQNVLSQEIKDSDYTIVKCNNCTVGEIVTSEIGSLSKSNPVNISNGPYSTSIVGVYQETEVKVINLEGSFTKKAYTVIDKGFANVKFNSENGPIKKGDPVTSSSQSGIAMKATQSGMILGIALEDANGKNGLVKIRVMVQYLKQ